MAMAETIKHDRTGERSGTRPSRPQRAHWLVRVYGKLLIKLTGWRMDMTVAYDYPSYVILKAPHTSNWDFVYAAMILGAADIRAAIIIKDDWMRVPVVGSIIESLGGVGISRSGAQNVVGQIVEKFRQDPQFIIGITPEGTRKQAEYWKTGFYYIAQQAGVPIVLGYLDYKRKVGGIAPIVVYPTGDIEGDIEQFTDFLATITPRYPEKRSPVRFKI